MIKSIFIKNFALIEEAKINLNKGFTVITGETGAGKSIMLGAIGIALGDRADSNIISDTSKKTIVELEINIDSKSIKEWFKLNDLDYYDTCIIRRELSPDGRSRAFINDTPVTNKLLKDLSLFTIDIHSQHQNTRISDSSYQLDMYDSFCEINSELISYKYLYSKYKKINSEYINELEAYNQKEKDKDYYKFRLNEIDTASPKDGEVEDLDKKLSILKNANNIKSTLSKIVHTIRDSDSSVLSLIKSLYKETSSMNDIFPEFEEYTERINSVSIELEDLADEAERKMDDVVDDYEEQKRVEERMNLLNNLLFKFRLKSTSELLQERENLINLLNAIDTSSERLNLLKQQIKDIQQDLEIKAENIHIKRLSKITEFENEVKSLLISLGIPNVNFKVQIEYANKLHSKGKDIIQLLFSANKNKPIVEISKVASGGETSRIMLVLKYLIANKIGLPTIIFDEIDTGLSGEVASRMADMMKDMAKGMQVISITHLPQIASAGDFHFKVYKEDNELGTLSKINQLNNSERLSEIASMISGKELSAASIKAAEILLKK